MDPPDGDNAGQWTQVAARLLAMARAFLAGLSAENGGDPQVFFDRLSLVLRLAADWLKEVPLAELRPPAGWLEQAEALWAAVESGADGSNAAPLRHDPRFADPLWRAQPYFAVVHQTYLLFCEQLDSAAGAIDGLDPPARARLQFVLRALTEALSPANFALTNPRVIERARETHGESLIRGFGHLLADLGRGQITHCDPKAFRLGETIAATPGKVVHETPLYQLIQYTPATARVLTTPLVIFPPWINRFYVFDLEPGKSFVRWAVGQGITTFIVSWKSADESMAGITWDDYIAAQIDAIEHVRKRLAVPSAHAMGYCVAGTTLAATLAVLARRSEADKVASATLLAAQVDFSEAGDLAHFIDDATIAAIGKLSPGGHLDGRYLAAIFNLLRPGGLIWPYAVRHYLLGEDYRAFDMLHWNGDVANLPAGWLADYLRDLYRDNRLVAPRSLSALGTPIDLSLVATPCFIQAGRDDHISPPHSVWKAMRHFAGPATFVLSGSGHIAGVVNPPSAVKYQFWTNPARVASFDDFVAGARETPGSWWPHWFEWLRGQGAGEVAARGRRRPGGRGEGGFEDAPGRFVMAR